MPRRGPTLYTGQAGRLIRHAGPHGLCDDGLSLFVRDHSILTGLTPWSGRWLGGSLRRGRGSLAQSYATIRGGEVFVVNVDGYIGESTRKEIEYAKSQGKPVRYMEPVCDDTQVG